MHTRLQNKTISSDTIFVRQLVRVDKKSIVNWFHLAGPSALKEYLTDELIPSMFLRALGITSVDGLPNKDLLFDVMEKRKNYIGRDTTNEIQTYLTQLDEQLEHTDDLDCQHFSRQLF